MGCRVIKMSQFYLSENHQKPKQEKVHISNDPTAVFKFKNGGTKYHEFIYNISYTPYTKKKKKEYKLSEFLDKKTRTTAFLVVRKDSILYEDYFEGYDESSLLPSWSVAKSFTSALVGIAEQEGFLRTSDSITKYFPELSNISSYWDELTVEHLLNMRSGIYFDEENYTNPFSSVADLYMSKDFMQILQRAKFIAKPGATHYYSSFDTEILGLVLEKSINQPLSKYLQDKIWKPLGMESSATWTIDSKSTQNTKTFCCLDVTLRDYAKFARLYLNKGYWNGKQIIDSSWVIQSISPNFDNDCYQNQWYSQSKGSGYYLDSIGELKQTTYQDSIIASKSITNTEYQRVLKQGTKWIIKSCGPEFYALGIFGQDVYVDPDTEMIFIRLGKKWDTSSVDIFYLIRHELKKQGYASD